MFECFATILPYSLYCRSESGGIKCITIWCGIFFNLFLVDEFREVIQCLSYFYRMKANGLNDPRYLYLPV